MNLFATLVTAIVVLSLVAVIIVSVLWVGKDARRRGFDKVWLLQLLCVVQFPWPLLMYYAVTRAQDRQRELASH